MKFIRKYECPHCGNIYSVGFWKWLCAPHLFDIWRWMKCPACGKRDWVNKIKE